MLVLVGLCKGMDALMRSKGHNPLVLQILAVVGWIGGEIAGAVFGVIYFAIAHPEIVSSFVKTECQAIDYWRANPAAAAKMVAGELQVDTPDAERMMRGARLVPCTEQKTSAYLGTPEAKGAFAESLRSVAAFLNKQGRLAVVADKNAYETFIDPSFLP